MRRRACVNRVRDAQRCRPASCLVLPLPEGGHAVRALTPLGSATFTDPAPTGVRIKALHINELRTAIDAARSNLSLAALTYGETITAGVTTPKTVHMTELRDGVK